MKHETFPPHEHLEGRFAPGRETLWVTRTLLANTARYVEHVEASSPDIPRDMLVYDDAAQDLLKRFYELASAQMSQHVIDQRLFSGGEAVEPADVLRAMDEILASWQRGSIVASQQQPLHELAMWLLDAQRVIALDVEDADLKHQIEQGIVLAEKRLAHL